MIRLRRSEERGHGVHGWLETWHTFSFAGYHDPAHMGFSVLRVLNQDVVAPGRGFGTHPHHDMEIVTWVLEGELRHQDSLGNGSAIVPGEAQVMSAGTGVSHSEANGSDDEPVHLLQMWVLPERRGTRPRYGQKAFPEAGRRGRLQLLVSPDGRDGSLRLGQDALLYVAQLQPGQQVGLPLEPGRCAWLHVARGALTMNGERAGHGDGAAVLAERQLLLTGADGSAPFAEVLVWDMPEPGEA